MNDSEGVTAGPSAGRDDLSGRTVGRFTIRARLGAGGMGEVYRADDTVLKRPVALKRIAPHLRADPYFRQRFLKEAERASSLTDPHVAGIYDVLEQSGEVFLVMEFVEGQTLRPRLARPLELAETLRIVTQCAQALAAAHARGLTHRDIKPENIMLTPAGQVKILDFGVARRLPRADDPTATESFATGAVSGTPAYMAPEALLGKESGARADIFSLGVVFYEMLTGRHPFRTGTPTATTDRILHETPPAPSSFNPAVPEALDDLVARMLAKNAEHRLATMEELLAALHALEPGPGAASAPRKLQRRIWAAVALLAIGIAVLAVWLWPPAPAPTAPVPTVAAKRLAVLPFENLSGRAEDEYFADGMTEELITSLARLRSLQLIARTSVMRFKDSRLPVSEIARQLDADYLVTGSVQRAGAQVRITAALIEPRREAQLWTDRYDRPFADVLAVQTEIADNVLQKLALFLGSAERAALAAPPTKDPAAYDAYLRGKSLAARFEGRGAEEDFRAAERLLREALELDPKMAAAYAQLARLYFYHDVARARSGDPERARQMAERSLTLEPDQVDALATLATMAFWGADPENAFSYARRALERNPSDSRTLWVLGGCYRTFGLLERSLEANGRAERADPLYVDPLTSAAVVLTMLGRFDEAWTQNEKAAALESDHWGVLLNRIWIRYHQGRLEDAARWVDEARRRLPESERPLAELFAAWIASRQGKHEQARATIAQVRNAPILGSRLFQYWLAEGLALENQKEEAISILEKNLRELGNYPWLARNSNLDSLRGDPRFQALLGRMRADWEGYRQRYDRPLPGVH